MRRDSAVRAAGAGVILVSVFLPWFVGESLYGMATLIAQGLLGNAPPEAIIFIYATSAFVAVGGLLSFATRIGGIFAIIGVGFSLGVFMVMSPAALAFMGIGVYAAIIGAIIVIASKHIAKLLTGVEQEPAQSETGGITYET